MKTSVAGQLMTSFRFTITVKAGPDSGKSFQLLPPQVTIGRDAGNHIVLSDPKVSRQQATIEFKNDKVVLVAKSARGNLMVNGTTVDITNLENGDRIQFGQSELLFRMDTVGLPQVVPNSGGISPIQPPSSQLTAIQSQPANFGYQVGGAAEPNANYSSSSRRRAEDAGRFRFYIIVIALIGGAVYFLTKEQPNVQTDRTLRTSDKVEAEIAESEKLQESLLKEKSFKSDADRRRYEDAQGHYLQGFRDLQKGNYSRAIKAFETSLAIDPGHIMARRYYKQATRSRDEFVVQHILEARQYKQRQMYPRCISAIDKSLGVMGEVLATDLKSKEAMTLRKECEALMKERF